MAARANWKGYLKLSLVSCAVALFPATSSSSRIAFHTLNRPTGNRVKRQFVDPETHDVVETADQVKGYPVSRGAYVQVEEEELEAIRIESTHTLNIESFVPREQIDERYLETPYYLVPEDKVAQEAFAVIRDAMREKDKAGLARIVLSHRERMVLLESHGKGLLATLLRYPYEIRPSAAFFDDLPDVDLPEEMKDLAGHIIDKKAGDFRPEQFQDRYEEAVLALIKTKQAGQEVRSTSGESKPAGVINIMDALKKSLAMAGADAKPKAGKAPAKSKPVAVETAPKPANDAHPAKPARAATPKRQAAAVRKAG